MPPIDLNLLAVLDVLLTEGSVARAAARLRLSPSATSRALTRLRRATGDPLLVRAGRGLVPTPRALELRERVGGLVHEIEAMLRPADRVDPALLARRFTIRAGDGFVENFGAALVGAAATEAPLVRLCFVPKPDKNSGPLRDGAIDLDIGVVGTATGPEIRTQRLYADRFVGVVRPGHQLAEGAVTSTRYAACRHVMVSRRGLDRGPIDEALEAAGHTRDVAVIVAGYAAALALARASDLVASVPERHTANLRAGLFAFPLPVTVREIVVFQQWHPRLDVDPAHRWLRSLVRRTCATAAPR